MSYDPMKARDPVEHLTRRHVLTDRGRVALGLPPVGDVTLVPLVDLPWRDEQPTERGDG